MGLYEVCCRAYFTYHSLLTLHHLILYTLGFYVHFHSLRRTHWHTMKIRIDIHTHTCITYTDLGLLTHTCSHIVNAQIYLSFTRIT